MGICRYLLNFPDLFKQIIEIAMQLGYVSLGHISMDVSKLKANASKHKAMTREYMKKEIARLEKEIQEAPRVVAVQPLKLKSDFNFLARK